MPSSTQQQDRSERAESSSDNGEESAADSSATDLTLPAVVPKTKSDKKSKNGKKHKEESIKPATVEVGPTVDETNGHGREGNHTVPAHQFNDAADNPHHGTEAKREHSTKSKSKSKKGKGDSDDEPSLFDKVHEDPKALRKAEKAAAAAEGDGNAHSHGKSSKKKHGKEHAHPPSFKESLAK